MWAPGVAAAVGIGAAHVGARYAGARGVAAILKGIPIVLLAALVAAEPSPVTERYRWLVFAGLLCSLAGDLCLVFPRGFVPGLLSFLAAHLLYIAAFAPAGGWDAAAWVLLLPFGGFGLAMLAYLWRHLGKERLPVAVYVSVIVLMGWRAAVRAGAAGVPPASGALACVGAILFMLSDGCLALDRFARSFRAADAAVMATYYAAQMLIALSVRT